MRPQQILVASATELGEAIRQRKTTSVEIVEAHIARIRQVNPTINALVKDRFDAALAEARIADEKTASMHRDDLPPLHGIPFTTKDALACEGMPNTSGLWTRRDTIATTDATAVKRLKAAGAILLGVTNISELCMWMESNNKVWGRTNNPYDETRTAGGSSGGEGSIVGSAGSVIGLGSDVGGSIRMPAFFNGVFGHKPTGGLVPNTGHYPGAENERQRYVTTGPIVRRAADLMPFLKIVAGPDGIEERCIEADRLGDPSKIDLSKITAFVIPDNGIFSVDRRMAAAQERAAQALERAGAKIERRKIPALKRSIEIWSSMIHAGSGAWSFEDLMREGAPDLRIGLELLKALVGRSNYTVPGLALCWIERLPGLMKKRTEKHVQLGRELRAELESLVGDDGVILFPSYPTVAPKHIAPLVPPLKWIYTGIFNVLEMPVTQVPMGLEKMSGGGGNFTAPTGVQVAAKNGNDALTIAVAIELERATGGWQVPPRWPI